MVASPARFFFALFAVGVAFLRAADTPAPSSTPVAFSFIVEDDHHNRPADLKTEELTLVDDGLAQKNVTLSLIPSGSAHRQLSVLVDSSSDDSIRLATDFLATENLSKIEVSVWDAAQLQLLQPFTSDRAALTASLARLRRTNGPTAATPAPLSAESVVRDANDYVQNEQLRPWMAILFALAKEQGASPGRKEVLYFVSNEDQTSATADQLSALVSNAAHAELSVYVLESRPLTVRAETQAAKMVAGKTKRVSKKASGAEPQAETGQNLLRELASRTGGIYWVAHSGAATDVLRAVNADIAVSYEVHYDPSIVAFDGHFRKLEVRCSRPHVKIRGPAGYVSAPPVSFFDLAPSEPALYGYLQSGKPETAFPLDCEAMQFGHKNGKVRAEVVIQLPLRALQAEEDETGTVSRFRFAILALVKTEDGRLVQKLGQDVLYQATKAAKSNLYTLTRPIWLDPGKYRVEIVARDENSERTTVKDISLSLGSANSGADVGDILLVRGAEKGDAEPDDDPLTYGTARIVPFASPNINLGKGSELPVLITVYPENGALPSDVELEIHRGDELYGTVPLLGTVDRFGHYRALVLLEQGSLPAGHYTFIARASSGEKVSEQRREIDLITAETASADVADDGVPEPVKPVLALEEPAIVATGKADEQELAPVLEGARNRADEYKRNLPNFSCVETTQQYAAKTAPAPNWKVKNTFSELLRYASGSEAYQTIEVNGERKTTERASLPGVRTDGEFGELLAGIYAPKSAAKFQLKGKARVDGADVYVVAYSIDRPRSFYMLSTADGASRVQCAFHGTVYIDARDFATRYVSIEAQDVPTNAQYRESTLFVKYDYITFDGVRYLLPKRASISVRVGKSKLMKDDIQFRDYRRFHATTRMILQ